MSESAETAGRLDVVGLSASYPRKMIFRDVSLTVSRGEIVGVFGSNGSGKSTLLRVVAGLKAPDRGTVRFEGGGPMRVATVAQDYRASFFPWATVLGNCRLVLREELRRGGDARDLVRRTQQELAIDLPLARRPQAYSGGMLQQAALLRAFASRPNVLLADEPFAALDFEIVRQVRHAFRRCVRERGIAALVVLHDLEDIVRVCDRVFVISRMPYSTDDGTARMVRNANLETACDDGGDGGLTFLQMAERLLRRAERT